jgi:hypothetical protein
LDARKPSYRIERQLIRMLDDARSLITAGDDRHPGLIDRIDELKEHYKDPMDVLNFMFGGRG